jgi:hypothetical protein
MSLALFGFGSRSNPARLKARRTFRPTLSAADGVLETREVLSTASAPAAMVSARAANTAVSVSTWNNQAAWSFINGSWRSTISSPILRGFLGRNFSIKSVDTWASSSTGVTLSNWSNFQVGQLRIQFQSNGTPTLTFQATADDTPVTLNATSATKNSVTFRGQAPASVVVGGQSVNTNQTTLTVTVTKVSNKSMQIRFAIGDGAKPVPILAYNATKRS